jgi:hypothetical protein
VQIFGFGLGILSVVTAKTGRSMNPPSVFLTLEKMFRFLFAILFISFFCVQVIASDEVTTCVGDSFREGTSITELPKQVQATLGRFRAGFFGIADAGEKFNKSDVSIGDMKDVPMSRFISAKIGDDCIFVRIERGGIGYSQEELTFTRKDGIWTQTQKQWKPVRR